MRSQPQIRVDGTRIVITIDASVEGDPPRAPGTKGENDKGTKNWMVASTGGNIAVPQRIQGRTMMVGVNLYTGDPPLSTKGKKAQAAEGEDN